MRFQSANLDCKRKYISPMKEPLTAVRRNGSSTPLANLVGSYLRLHIRSNLSIYFLIQPLSRLQGTTNPHPPPPTVVVQSQPPPHPATFPAHTRPTSPPPLNLPYYPPFLTCHNHTIKVPRPDLSTTLDKVHITQCNQSSHPSLPPSLHINPSQKFHAPL